MPCASSSNVTFCPIVQDSLVTPGPVDCASIDTLICIPSESSESPPPVVISSLDQDSIL